MKRWVIGIDEVGRGPLAGPLYVCAVAVPESLYARAQWKGLTYSKLMTPKSREKWYMHAIEMKKEGKVRIALAYKSASHIDQKGISLCTVWCVNAVLKKLDISPKDCTVLLDGGLRAPLVYTQQQTIIKGDKSEKAISLASVVAKVTRDRVMEKMHKLHPEFGWHSNKGYGTKSHIGSLKKAGVTPLHRRSFLSRVLDK